jgi:aldose 1-epimerase
MCLRFSWISIMPVLTITDRHSGSTARIAPELGFNCFEFRAMVAGQPVDVLDAMPGFDEGGQKASGSGIPILFPFPNRIRAGKFSWKGRDFSLPTTDKFGNAIHGLCLDRPWRVIEHKDDLVTGQFQLSVDAPDRLHLWPTDFLIEVDYEIVHNRLRANFRIGNPSNQSLPWGLGTHPYFKLPLGANSRVDDCLVEVPAARRWELIDCLPTGKLLELEESNDLRDGEYVSVLKLDDVYTSIDCDGPQFDCTVMDERAGLQVVQTCPPIFREIVAFTPPSRAAVCIEPYTCPTDAINLTAQGIDCGWRTLGPGSEFHTWIDITAGPVLA